MRRSGPLHLLARWELIRRRLRRTRRLVLMLDFDGTLAPLRARRSQARLGSGVRRLLESFARRPNTAVYLISGRRLADLRRHARIAGARFLGLHGWESARGLPPPSRAYRMIRKLKRRLAPRLRNLRGIELEDKGLGLGLHYRLAAPHTAALARAALRQALRGFNGCLRVIDGKKVREVLPSENPGKGAAVTSLARGWTASTLAFYLGDDTSDEPAFRNLPEAVTVLVGRRRRTAARYRLRGPEEVREFLERLELEVG